MTRVDLLDPGPLVELRATKESRRLIRWGHQWQVGTPAYWVALTSLVEMDASTTRGEEAHRLGRNLLEEVAVCMLGGHGQHNRIGIAAFQALRDAGLLRIGVSASEVEQVLRSPLAVADRKVHYRFPRQKAKYLAAAMNAMNALPPGSSPKEVRLWLEKLDGIGPKTSAWIVRNYFAADDVAIVDVHVTRAASRAGIFDSAWIPSRDYGIMEAYFLQWAGYGGVHAANLDAVIWKEAAANPNVYRGQAGLMRGPALDLVGLRGAGG